MPSEQAVFLQQGAAGQIASLQPSTDAAQDLAQAGVASNTWEEVGHLLAPVPIGPAGCPSCAARCRPGVGVMLTALRQRAFLGGEEASWGAQEGEEACACLPQARPSLQHSICLQV